MKRILVIDGNDAFRPVLSKALRRQGYMVLEAANGEAGLDLARVALPDLVVLDVVVKGTNPFGVLRTLRSQPSTSALQVVLMANGPLCESSHSGWQEGADGYLAKSSGIEALLVAVKAGLDRQRTLETQAKANEARLMEVFSLTQDLVGIADARDGYFQYLNLAGRKMLGIGVAEDISNLSLTTFQVGARLGWLDDDRVREAKARGVWVGESGFANRDGRVIPVSQQILAHRSESGPIEYLSVVARDISEQKNIEAAALENLAKYQQLVEAISDWVWEADIEGRYVYSSPKVQDILGYAPEEIVGQTFAHIMPPVEVGRVRSLVKEAAAAGRACLRLETHYLHQGGNLVLLETNLIFNRGSDGRVLGLRGVDRDITERYRAEQQLRQLSQAVEQSPDSVMITDPAGRIEYVNPRFTEVCGYTVDEVRGKDPSFLKSGVNPNAVYRDLWNCITSGKRWHGELCNRRRDGGLFWEVVSISPIKGQAGETAGFLAIKRDVTEQKRAEKERSLMEVQLRQAQKLEAIGRLAAGIAHEINTPIQYVSDNTRFLQESFQNLQLTLKSHLELLQAARTNRLTPELIARAESVLASSDLGYISEQVPAAIKETLEGVERVTRIVRAMREFSHPGGKDKALADINQAVETTITVARNEWKYVAELKLDLDPNLPLVPCFVGEFNQAILNLIVNAAQSISDVQGTHPLEKGAISVSTRREGEFVEIRVGDTGTGIPEAIRSRIFEPFFTTKDVGKGTGQGLSMVYGSIVRMHGGTVTFETEAGKGTTFILRIPTSSRGGGITAGPFQRQEPAGPPTGVSDG